MILTLAIFAMWIGGAAFSYGVCVATLQSFWNRPDWAREQLPRHRKQAAILALFGPIMAFVLLAYGDLRHGWRL